MTDDAPLGAGHRQLHWLCADAQTAGQLLGQLHGRLEEPEAQPLRALIVDERFKRKYHDYLGQTYDLLVVSAWSGFSPNAFAALSATVRGSGLIVLLTPAPPAWLAYDDPEYERLLAHPWTAADSPALFIRYFMNALEASVGAPQFVNASAIDATIDSLIRAIRPSNSHPAEERQANSEPHASTSREQATVLAQITAGAGRVDIISAERGRGKSTLLGFLAGKLVTDDSVICVTSLHPWQCSVALRQSGGALSYRAPDDLLSSGQRLHLLFVDEAAALPLPMLLRLIDIADQVVLASTSHGYEGSGQGFRLRLLGHLQSKGREPHWHTLEQAIRWDADDPVEAFVTNTLLFQRPQHDQTSFPILLGAPEIVDKAALAADTAKLSAVMRLLMESHYQTSADDARVLLDSPGITLTGIFDKSGGHPVALLMTDSELPFEDAELREAIWLGRRRPRGHLTQQVLAQQLGIQDSLERKVVRIVRVAVASDYRRRGLATQLLRHLEMLAPSVGETSALHSASFGNDPVSLSFWLSQDYTLVRQGQRQSGSHGGEALLVLKPRNESGERIQQRALSARSRALATDTAGANRQGHQSGLLFWPQPPLEAWEHELIKLFCLGARPVEAVLSLLYIDTGHRPDRLDTHWQSALREMIAGTDWTALTRLTGLAGKKAVVAGLRAAYARAILPE